MKLRRFVALLLTLAMLSCAMPASLMEEQIDPPVVAQLDPPVEEYGASLDELTIGEEGSDNESTPVQQDNGLVIESEETTAISEGSAVDEVKSEPVAALEAQTYDWTITGSDKRTLDIGDTLRIVVSGAEVLSWTTKSKKIVPSVAFSGGMAEVKPIAAGKATLKASVKVGSKKKTYTVTLTVTDPYVPKSIAFDSSMKSTLPVGAIIKLSDYIVLTPADARNNLTYKVSGAGKLAKDGVTMTTTKAGTATITVTSKDNKKVKMTYKVTVQANKVTNLCAKPGKSDIAAVSGGWTLWPNSVEVDKKGGILCQFYLINGTGQKATKIENMNLSLYQNGRQLTSYNFASTKASVAKDKAALVKVTFPAAACVDIGSFYLPDGGIEFDVDLNAGLRLVAGKGTYEFVPTMFPENQEKTDFIIENGILTKYIGNDANVVIPNYDADGNKVIGIGENAFYECNCISSVTIPDGVTSIDKDAFSCCSNLISISIPESVKNINISAFFGCSSLRSITIPEGVTCIDWFLFSGCSSLTSVTIPRSVTEIFSWAFTNCSSLMSITIPDSVTAIDQCAFKGCSSLKAITIYENVSFIDNSAFHDCNDDLVIYGKAGSYAEQYAKDNGIGFESIAFENNILVSEILIDQTTATLEVGQSLALAVTVSPDNANNKNVVWSSSNNSIASVTNTGFVTAKEAGSATITAAAIDGSGKKAECQVNVKTTTPISSDDDASPMGDFIIENGVVTKYVGHDTSVVIPKYDADDNRIIGIGDSAFSNSLIEYITIPEGVLSIGNNAFSNTRLIYMNIREGLISIGNCAFSGCHSIIAITIPESVNDIANDAFYDSSNRLLISGKTGSFANKFANNNNLNFQDIDFVDYVSIELSGNRNDIPSPRIWNMSEETRLGDYITATVFSIKPWSAILENETDAFLKFVKTDKFSATVNSDTSASGAAGTILHLRVMVNNIVNDGKTNKATLTFNCQNSRVNRPESYTIQLKAKETPPAVKVGKPVIKNAKTNAVFAENKTVEYEKSNGSLTLSVSAENGCGQYKIVVIGLKEAPDYSDKGSNQAANRDTSMFTNGYAYNDVCSDETIKGWGGIPIKVSDIPEGRYVKIAVGAYASPSDPEPATWTNIGLKIVKPQTIPVTGVTLDKTNLTLQVGESATLTAQVTPTNATNKKITWSSSNRSVATVNNGKITAVGEGTATITVKTVDGGKEDSCIVNVRIDISIGIQSLKLDKTYNITDELNHIRALYSPGPLLSLYTDIESDMNAVDGYEMIVEHPIKTSVSALGYAIGFPKSLENLHSSYYEDAASSVMFYLSGANRTDAETMINTLNKWKELLNVVDIGFNVISAHKLNVKFKEMIGSDNFSKLPDGKIKTLLNSQYLVINPDVWKKMTKEDTDGMDIAKAIKKSSANIINGMMENVYRQAAVQVFQSQLKEIIDSMDSSSLYGKSLQKVMDKVNEDRNIVGEVIIDSIKDSVGELTNPIIDCTFKIALDGKIVKNIGELSVDFVTEAFPVAKATKLGWKTGAEIADFLVSTKDTAKAMREYSILILLMDHALNNLKRVAENTPDNATPAQIAQLRSALSIYYNIVESTIDVGHKLIDVLYNTHFKEWRNGGKKNRVLEHTNLSNVRYDYYQKLLDYYWKLFDICPEAESSNYL